MELSALHHMQVLKAASKKFPNKPGVYFWRDKKGAPLYIGRAGSLKRRIANYFLVPRSLGEVGTRDPRINEMVHKAHSLDFEITDLVLEAIVLEANLIKKHWPKYNILEKDGKSFMYMVVTDEDFPRLLMVRGRELEKYSSVIASKAKQSRNLDRHGIPRDDKRYRTLGIFGPYLSFYLLRKSLEIIRKIFPYSNCKPYIPNSYELAHKGRACFHYQIGLCPGVCVGAIDSKTYRNNIRNIILFFRGEKKQLLKKLQKERPDAILALKQVRDTALLADSDVLLRSSGLTDRRIEGYDISHSGGKEPVGSMVVFEDGEKDSSQYRLFKIKGSAHASPKASQGNMPNLPIQNFDDLQMLEEVLTRRLRHIEWPMPDIVFIDGGANQVRRAVQVLKKHNVHVPVVGLSKGGKHAGSAYATDKLVIANSKKIGKELIIASKNLFQEVRNEAHRFAIGFQRKRAKRSFLK